MNVIILYKFKIRISDYRMIHDTIIAHTHETHDFSYPGVCSLSPITVDALV